jgi:hypothetical protein
MQPDYQQLLDCAEQAIFKHRLHEPFYPVTLSNSAEILRWFALPQDCFADLEDAQHTAHPLAQTAG